MEMQIITMESEAFYELVEQVVSRIGNKQPHRWIAESEAMQLLGIKSKSHLWKLRTECKVEFFQDEDHPKLIMYDRESLERYLENNSKRTF
jgi:hypothetical protein